MLQTLVVAGIVRVLSKPVAALEMVFKLVTLIAPAAPPTTRVGSVTNVKDCAPTLMVGVCVAVAGAKLVLPLCVAVMTQAGVVAMPVTTPVAVTKQDELLVV